MKILFAGVDEDLRCIKCNTVIIPDYSFSEDGDLDFPWCESCVDFVSSIVTKKGEVK